MGSRCFHQSSWAMTFATVLLYRVSLRSVPLNASHAVTAEDPAVTTAVQCAAYKRAAPITPVFRPSFPRVPSGMRSTHPHKCHARIARLTLYPWYPIQLHDQNCSAVLTSTKASTVPLNAPIRSNTSEIARARQFVGRRLW